MKSYAVLPLRFGLGVIFLYHGLQKVFGLFGGSGIEGFSMMLSGLGFSSAQLLATLVAYIELFGGIFLLLGVLVRLSALSLLVVMIVALLKVHLQKGFSLMSGGYEYNFLIILSCISLIISGADKLSLANKISILKKL